MKIDLLKRHRAAAVHFGQGQRLHGGGNGRLVGQQFHQPLGGPSRTQQVAIDLTEHRKGTGEDDHINHGLPQMPGRNAARHHRLRALEQAPQQRCRGRNNDETDQH